MRKSLSVIVPVYNVAQHLRQCLVSLDGQWDEDCYEVLLVNDASMDNSRGICSEWCAEHPCFRLINREQNGGLSEARNTGLREAKGDYLAFCDSDDFIASDTFRHALNVIGDADVVEFPVMVGHYSKHAYRDASFDGIVTFKQWLDKDGWMHCYACNKVYSRKLWDGVAFPVGRNYEDIFTIPYLLRRANKIACTSKGLYYYCQRPGSITHTLSIKNLTDYAMSLDSLLELPESKGNYHMLLGALNAETTLRRQYMKENGYKVRRVKRKERFPWSYVFAKGLKLRERLKIVYFKITRRA